MFIGYIRPGTNELTINTRVSPSNKAKVDMEVTSGLMYLFLKLTYLISLFLSVYILYDNFN